MLRRLEMGVMDHVAGGDAHGRVVKGTAVYRADAWPAPQAHERIVGRHLLVVAIGTGLRQPIQLTSLQPIGTAGLQMPGYMGDVRPPAGLRTARRRIDL